MKTSIAPGVLKSGIQFSTQGWRWSVKSALLAIGCVSTPHLIGPSSPQNLETGKEELVCPLEGALLFTKRDGRQRADDSSRDRPDVIEGLRHIHSVLQIIVLYFFHMFLY